MSSRPSRSGGGSSPPHRRYRRADGEPAARRHESSTTSRACCSCDGGRTSRSTSGSVRITSRRRAHIRRHHGRRWPDSHRQTDSTAGLRVARPARRSAVIAAERRIPFEGITNLRDLGGYPTADGGTTRWGRVFRADALHKLTAADLDAFQRAGRADGLRPARRRRARRVPGAGRLAARVDRRPARDVDTPPPPTGDDRRRRRADAARHVRRRPQAQRRRDRRRRCAASPTRDVRRPCSTATAARTAPGSSPPCCCSRWASTARRCSTTTRRPAVTASSRTSRTAWPTCWPAGVSPEAAAGVLGTPRWAMADGRRRAPRLPHGRRRVSHRSRRLGTRRTGRPASASRHPAGAD